MSSRRALDVIEVESPCSASWDQMTGDEVRRFCPHCNKFVHNLSAIPAGEAEQLVCSSAGDLCVRFTRDMKSNRLLTLDYSPVPKPARRGIFEIIAMVVAGLCVGGVVLNLSTPTMGKVRRPRRILPTTRQTAPSNCQSQVLGTCEDDSQ